jgi:hypothetical protein
VKVCLLQTRLKGGFGPQPHPGFIEVSGEVAIHNCDGTLEGARENGNNVSGDLEYAFNAHTRPVGCQPRFGALVWVVQDFQRSIVPNSHRRHTFLYPDKKTLPTKIRANS